MLDDNLSADFMRPVSTNLNSREVRYRSNRNRASYIILGSRVVISSRILYLNYKLPYNASVKLPYNASVSLQQSLKSWVGQLFEKELILFLWLLNTSVASSITFEFEF